MGSKGSKDGKGKDQNKLPRNLSEAGNNTINLTNDIIVGKSSNNPNDDYIRSQFLGEGSFAAVYKVKNKITSVFRAMKVINKSSSCSAEDDKELFNEITILRTMDHPNILKIFEFYANSNSYSIVTEICSGGELFQEIIDLGPFTEKYSSYVMYQIFSAINYCHNMHIVHRDLKPENILIVKKEKNGFPHIKICDFGTSKMFEKGKIERRLVGSSYYIAPEVLKKNYNEKCDLWSCGVILYILLSGKPPFAGENDEEIMKRVSTGVYDLSSPPFNNLSKEVLNLISSLLVMDPNKRISAEAAWNHPWIKTFKSKELFNEIKSTSTIQWFIENLKTYKADSVIQETALAYLVHNYSQIDEVMNACKLFNQIDVSGDGKINQKELLKGWKERFRSDTWEQDVAIIFKNIDADNNGYIEYEEFVRAAIPKEIFLDEKILRFAFRYFDKDNSGEITYDEIEEVFKQAVTDKSKVQTSLRQIISEVDLNNDGIISFEEFSQIMIKMLDKKK